MATKLIINIEEGLSRQEIDDLRFLLADAFSEFAVRRTTPYAYVAGRYPHLDHRSPAFDHKVAQVKRRVDLAAKLHINVVQIDLTQALEHVLPHEPLPVLGYYARCDETDLPAMSAALELLPVAVFGERIGWMVKRENGILILQGPDDRRAFWHELGERWIWLEEGQEISTMETVQ